MTQTNDVTILQEERVIEEEGGPSSAAFGGGGSGGPGIDGLGRAIGGISGGLSLSSGSGGTVIASSRLSIGSQSGGALRRWFAVFFDRLAGNLKKAARIINQTAPVRSGRLKKSIRVTRKKRGDGGFVISAEMVFYGKFARGGTWFKQAQRDWASAINRSVSDAARWANATAG